jgi:hypothetical protein
MSEKNLLADTPNAERFAEPIKLTEKRTQYLGDEMSQSLNSLNIMLTVFSDDIKKNQPKKPGSVILHFTKCSKSCNGCPHPIWMQWFNPTNGVDPDKWAAKKVTHPKRHLAKNATPELKKGIDDALKLIETRRKLVEAIGMISKCVTWVEKKYPAIFSQ